MSASIIIEPMSDHTRIMGVASMLRVAEVAEVAEILAITPAQVRRDAIAAGLEAGEQPVDIARGLHVSRAYVHKVARSLGWSQEAVIAARRARVVRMTEAGLPVAQIADQVGVAVRTVVNDRSTRRRRPRRGR